MHRALRVGAIAFAMLGAVACNKAKEEAPKSSLPGAVRTSINQALSAYEEIRVALSQDRANVRGPSMKLAGAARVALSTGAPTTLRVPLEGLSAAAQKLATLVTQDLAEVRGAFGEVSESVVALLAAEPSLQKGRYVFECPMAKGYKKWVQVNDKVSNPYFGSEMPECGAEASF